MRIVNRYDLWPRRRDNSLLFHSSGDAFFYAAQVYNKSSEIAVVRKQFEAINIELQKEKESKKPNLSFMLNSAFKRQFHRECLEEIDRLRQRFGV